MGPKGLAVPIESAQKTIQQLWHQIRGGSSRPLFVWLFWPHCDPLYRRSLDESSPVLQPKRFHFHLGRCYCATSAKRRALTSLQYPRPATTISYVPWDLFLQDIPVQPESGK